MDEFGCSPVHRTPWAHPELRPGAGQEVGESVHDGRGHRQGSDVLVDLLQLADNSAGHQLQHMVRKVKGHRGPLREQRTGDTGSEPQCSLQHRTSHYIFMD